MVKSVLIVAGGSGKRMSAELPKQFLPLNGLPVLMHSINAFYNYSPEINIYVALNPEWNYYWQQLCAEMQFKIPHTLTEGGTTRFESVKKGLETMSSDGLIAIHDGARPLISNELIAKCFEEARVYGNSVPSLPVNDSLRQINGLDNKPVPREKYVTVQTPQIFWAEILKMAYETTADSSFTDDASVVEDQGLAIKLTEGEQRNIKITLPNDLKIAEAYLSDCASTLPGRF